MRAYLQYSLYNTQVGADVCMNTHSAVHLQSNSVKPCVVWLNHKGAAWWMKDEPRALTWHFYPLLCLHTLTLSFLTPSSEACSPVWHAWSCLHTCTSCSSSSRTACQSCPICPLRYTRLLLCSSNSPAVLFISYIFWAVIVAGHYQCRLQRFIEVEVVIWSRVEISLETCQTLCTKSGQDLSYPNWCILSDNSHTHPSAQTGRIQFSVLPHNLHFK